ncbi:hypothetical protein BVRB_004030 [Beta vulgaris subsp. vulgaris]|uniref:Uncharacterized protein n=1 Tax=Beta vulgaris subsp. vulgaris TaxID=3555 RepID=A0A0J8B7F2_BETVV|nr:hypothetical protein BVRB_004030 [Beta vulgaris subsp. vulgaris]
MTQQTYGPARELRPKHVNYGPASNTLLSLDPNSLSSLITPITLLSLDPNSLSPPS